MFVDRGAVQLRVVSPLARPAASSGMLRLLALAGSYCALLHAGGPVDLRGDVHLRRDLPPWGAGPGGASSRPTPPPQGSGPGVASSRCTPLDERGLSVAIVLGRGDASSARRHVRSLAKRKLPDEKRGDERDGDDGQPGQENRMQRVGQAVPYAGGDHRRQVSELRWLEHRTGAGR